MKKIISVIIIVLMIASLVAAAVNGWSDEEYVRSGDNGNVIVPYVTDKDIMIDGMLSPGEWSETNKLALEGKKTMKTWFIGEFEGTIDFYCSWGEAGFYIAAVIYDDQIEKGTSNEGALATRFQIALNPAGIICNDYMGLFFSLTPVLESDRVALMRHNWQTQADDGFFVGEDEGYTGKYTFIQDGENVVGWNLECIIPWDMIATGDRYTDLDEKDEIYLTSFSPKDENRKRAFCTAMIAYVQCNEHDNYGYVSTARTCTDGDASKWTVDSHDLNFLFALPGETDRTTETEYFTENKEPNETTQPVTVDTEPETEPEPSTDSAGVAGDINGDSEVNNKDVVTLFRYVSGVEKEEDETAYDYNGDGEVNNKDVVALFRFLSTAGEEKPAYTPDEYFDFTLLGDGTYEIKAKDVNNMPDEVIIPKTHDGKPVTSIGDEAFGRFYYAGSTLSCNFSNVIIPDGITNIGNDAFLGCNVLKSISIPDSVMSIGDEAFLWCENLEYNEYNNALYLGNENNPCIILFKAKDTSITSVSINENTKFIYDGAFSGCSSLENVIIPDSVTSIGKSAFYQCSGLTDLTIGNSVVSLSDDAFYGCTSLINVTIPDNVTNIGQYTFCGCSSLTSVTISDSVKSIGYCAFRDCENLQYNEYDNALYLGNENNPFMWLMKAKNEYITSIEIYDDTKAIYMEAFSGCVYLINVEIPEGVTNIGDSAFYKCVNLISVIIPDSVTIIGWNAFCECYSLASVIIPENVTSIGKLVFSHCNNLNSIIVNKNNPVYHSSGNCIIETESKTLIAGCKNSVIPDDGSVIVISDYAFEGCSNLSSVTIPDSVTRICYGAFEYCTSLTSLTMGNGVMIIDDQVFYNCDSLKYNEYNNALYLGNDDNPYIWLIKAKDKSITSVTINDKTRFLYESAFYGCRNLASVIIPDGITKISSCAFDGCSNLTSVTIPDSVTSLESCAFSGCDLKDIYYKGTMAEWNNIEKHYGRYASWNLGLDNYTVHCTDGDLYE